MDELAAALGGFGAEVGEDVGLAQDGDLHGLEVVSRVAFDVDLQMLHGGRSLRGEGELLVVLGHSRFDGGEFGHRDEDLAVVGGGTVTANVQLGAKRVDRDAGVPQGGDPHAIGGDEACRGCSEVATAMRLLDDGNLHGLEVVGGVGGYVQFQGLFHVLFLLFMSSDDRKLWLRLLLFALDTQTNFTVAYAG